MIREVSRAIALTRRERALALRALGWLLFAASALRVCKHATIRAALTRIPPRRAVRHPITAAECERALERARRVLPGARCLAQAIAGACLLGRDGRDSTLNIGVRFGRDRRFDAHAWLEADSVIITGKTPADHRVLLRDVVRAKSVPQTP
jgi:transglutaminase superfamily protein